MDVKRLILFVVLSFSILFFWNTWQEKRMPVEQVASSQTNNPVKTNAAGIDQETGVPKL